MADGQIRIGPNGKVSIDVVSTLDQPAIATMRAENGFVVLPDPPRSPGGLKFNPDEQADGLIEAIEYLRKHARAQRDPK